MLATTPFIVFLATALFLHPAAATAKDLACKMAPWVADGPRTHISPEEAMRCLSLPSEDVDPVFKQVFYLEEVPVGWGGIRKGIEGDVAARYDSDVKDRLGRAKIRSALARLYRDTDEASIPPTVREVLSRTE